MLPVPNTRFACHLDVLPAIPSAIKERLSNIMAWRRASDRRSGVSSQCVEVGRFLHALSCRSILCRQSDLAATWQPPPRSRFPCYMSVIPWKIEAQDFIVPTQSAKHGEGKPLSLCGILLPACAAASGRIRGRFAFLLSSQSSRNLTSGSCQQTSRFMAAVRRFET